MSEGNCNKEEDLNPEKVNVIKRFFDLEIKKNLSFVKITTERIDVTRKRISQIRYAVAVNKVLPNNQNIMDANENKVGGTKRKQKSDDSDSIVKKPKYVPPIIEKKSDIYFISCSLRGDNCTKIVGLTIGAIILPLSIKDAYSSHNLCGYERQLVSVGSSHMWKLYCVPSEDIENALEYIEKIVIFIHSSYGQEVNEIIIDESAKKNGIVIKRYGSVSFTMRSNIFFKNPHFNRPIECLGRMELVVDLITGFEQTIKIQILAPTNKQELPLACNIVSAEESVPSSSGGFTKVEESCLIFSDESGVSKVTKKFDCNSVCSVTNKLVPASKTQRQWKSILKKNSKNVDKEEKLKNKVKKQQIRSKYLFFQNLQTNSWLRNRSMKVTCEVFIYELTKELIKKQTFLNEFHITLRNMIDNSAGQVNTMQCADLICNILKENECYIELPLWDIQSVKEYILDHSFFKNYIKNRRINYMKPVTHLPVSTLSVPSYTLVSFGSNIQFENHTEQLNICGVSSDNTNNGGVIPIIGGNSTVQINSEPMPSTSANTPLNNNVLRSEIDSEVCNIANPEVPTEQTNDNDPGEIHNDDELTDFILDCLGFPKIQIALKRIRGGTELLKCSEFLQSKHNFLCIRTTLIDWLLEVVRLIGIRIDYSVDNFVPQLLESIYNSFAEYLLRKCLSVINSKGKRRLNSIKKKDVLLAIIRTKRLHFLTEEGFGKPLDINSIHYKY
ncbi:uncharacterized protein LOC142323164 [Lycorma delicatula]|uniref:uncharacterized protein LOC142323164 n=1 Tax=Lycorma delicatula TaxID=130591 RepID=UPI003F50EA67